MDMNKNTYREFLEFVAFEPEELETATEEWIKASQILGLAEEDIRYAMEEYIPDNWDVKFLGVRKIVGAVIREAIDLTKAKDYKKDGVKVVYGILPAILSNYMAIKVSGGDRVYVGFPDIFLAKVLNAFFHKLDPFLENAEQNGMSYGCRHCALNKTRITAKMQDVIPSPDIIWTWGLNCDEGPKTDEFINCYFDDDWNVEITRIPHDTYWGDCDSDNEERIDYLADQLNHSVRVVEETVGFKVTPESLKAASTATRQYAMKIAQLNSMCMKADPFPIGGNVLSILGSPLSMPYNTGLKHMEGAVDILIKEVKADIKNGVGILEKGAPRVGVYFTPYCVPWVDTIFRENGVALGFSLISVVTKKAMMKPMKYKDDPYRIVAEQWLRSAAGGNMGYEFETWVDKVETFKPDAMLMGFFDFDRWLGAHQKMGTMYVEEKTGVPHFYMEADFWEDRDYSAEGLRTRIESICQVAKMNKKMKEMGK
ncbi:MAG: hypothetical protein C0604_06540 [Clostridiales bacterium]|nr:MAG: hypothetical protein C0604_06540 [Clostridiales bacterium]